MFTPESLDRIRDSGVSALIQLEPVRLPDTARIYLDRFVFRRGLRSVCALDLDLPEGRRGVVGIFHEDADGLADADLAGFSVIVRQLSALSRRLPVTASGPLDVLTPRLREVAELVGAGSTNAAIARRTGLTLDTVEKYVSQILERTGCANRTELAERVMARQPDGVPRSAGAAVGGEPPRPGRSRVFLPAEAAP